MIIKNNINSPKRFNVNDLLNFLSNKFKISDEVELIVGYNDKLLNQLSEDIEYKALLQNPIPHKYVLFVKENLGIELGRILCHEFVHLTQYESGDLKVNNNFTEIYWKGQKYNNSVPYDEREWEKIAFELENKLWKEFKNGNKNR